MRHCLSALWYRWNYWTVKVGLTLGFSLRIEGARHVPPSGPCLLVANHESFLDPPLVGVASPRIVWYLGRKTLFRQRLFGALIHSLNCVPVDQDGVAKDGLKAVLKLLEAGQAVVVFPEGERSWNGEMNSLKPGIHLLIKRVPAPIVPVGIAGAFHAFPRSKVLPAALSPLFLPATGTSLAVSVGRPIPPERYWGMPRAKVLADLHEEIAAMRQRAKQLRRKG